MSAPELTLLYDGSCPICCWEQRHLAARDRDERLGFVDIQAPGFSPVAYGIGMDELMGRMHGITDDGRILVGIDTLIASYRAVGCWWLHLPLAALPHRFSAWCYDAFAHRRHAISGRIGHWFGPHCDANSCRRKP